MSSPFKILILFARPALFMVFVSLGLGGCTRPGDEAPERSGRFESADASRTPSHHACAECHREIVDSWTRSHHANAMRFVSQADLDRATGVGPFVDGAATTHFERVDGETVFVQGAEDGFAFTGTPRAVLGYTPLVQYLVDAPGGRWQVFDPAHDPHSNEWFGVYGSDRRHPSEWGGWQGRGMNWNVQCAYCHMTGLRKQYDPPSDSYATRWDHLGVSCVQCHDPVVAGGRREDGCRVQAAGIDAQARMQHCAACHSRRGEIDEEIRPGANYHDHYLLALPDQPGLYHADGQILDEDYVYGSFIMSRMHAKGVTCADCHDPHSNALKLPAKNNGLCMQCHTAPGKNGATPIDVAAHTHHAAGSAGARCVECHMPETTYMQRDPRRDHGFVSPDPNLTIEHGVPNACNRCHSDETPQWALEHYTAWYGTNAGAHARARARLVARAYSNDTSVADELVAFVAGEEVDAWRATLLSLAGQLSADPRVERALIAGAMDPSPLVRGRVASRLREHGGHESVLAELVKDPVRSVRVQAGLGLLPTPDRDAAWMRELRAWIAHGSDQPSGAIQAATLALVENRPMDAQRWADRAAAWDPRGAGASAERARIYHRGGDLRTAELAFVRAVELAPDAAQHRYDLALLYAETGRLADAVAQLETVVALDPAYHRAWYNLGLGYAGQGQVSKAASALAKAEAEAPQLADYPYAQATVLARMGDLDAARAAAGRAVALGHPQGPALLMQLR